MMLGFAADYSSRNALLPSCFHNYCLSVVEQKWLQSETAVRPPAILLSPPVQLLINPNVESANHMSKTQCM